ncbi:MAG: hypothetical protein ACTHJN_07005 [Ginsengibacter sp.]
MKYAIIILTCFSFISTKGQDVKLNHFDDYFQVKKPGNLPGTYDLTGSKAPWKLISENGKGKVWESPVDKMRCMAFKFKSQMPVLGKSAGSKSLQPNITIPNPMLYDPSIPLPLNTKEQISK